MLMFGCISCSHILINLINNTAAKCHQNNVLYCQSLSPATKNLDVQTHVSLEQEQGKGFWYQLTREGNVLEQKKREER